MLWKANGKRVYNQGDPLLDREEGERTETGVEEGRE
jgi:hypothetical protein